MIYSKNYHKGENSLNEKSHNKMKHALIDFYFFIVNKEKEIYTIYGGYKRYLNPYTKKS